jgi:hypothetical protein
MKFSKWVVGIIILLNVTFTAGVLTVFWHTGAEPVATVTAFFAFTTGELWLMSGIKKARIKKEDCSG